jgi:hypothetical protein
MRLPPLVFLLGYAGLIPFIVAPLWLTVSPQTAPGWLDHVWVSYAVMIACFMSGTFWGLALIVAEGPNGMIGLALSATLMILTWGASLLPFRQELLALAAVYLLLALCEIWRERTIDPLGGYSMLRVTLTVGVLLTIGWRLMLRVPLS